MMTMNNYQEELKNCNAKELFNLYKDQLEKKTNALKGGMFSLVGLLVNTEHMYNLYNQGLNLEDPWTHIYYAISGACIGGIIIFSNRYRTTNKNIEEIDKQLENYLEKVK